MDKLIVNGKSANVAEKGVIALLFAMIVGTVYLVSMDKEIPDIFIATITLLSGFLIGTRTVPENVKQEVLRQDKKKNGAPSNGDV